ncbi:LysR family transcriptional regulator [Jiella sp. MQZ9-1]|uniref:LysR family transcriptional regulator n=1 Tax=Jiella flava TaxID=2816857 RepID=A0A939G0A1_9HYPH|nr:LysR substrate-binding domain-containing protein [Jiella flava]MBO0663446.1 LysR family transcriptional regulator [Jiella flava]MCD2472021.1 LysR family transcriptional regulator [Jiella flava]
MNQLAPVVANLDVDLLRTFVAICETGNFTRAAERVFRSPSAVSLQVKKLEDLVGRPLFRRETRSVELTIDGECLLGFARKLLRLNDEALEHFRRPVMEGRVRFGAPDDSGIFAIPEILKRFASTHPQVEVEVRLDTSDELRRRCLAGDLDVVLFTCENGFGLPVRPVHTEMLVWVGMKNGCAAMHDPLPLAVAEHGCFWRSLALSALQQAGLDYRIAYSSGQCQAQIAAVEADLAVAALPTSVLSPRLVRLDGVGGLPPIGTYRVDMLTRDGAGPVAEALAEHVAASFGERTGQNLRLFA